MQESLRNISHCPLTAVVAPMGYGKTTAIGWYLKNREEAENAEAIIPITGRFSGKAPRKHLQMQAFRFFWNMNFLRSFLSR